MSKRFSTADVAAHKTADDLYIIVDEDVYDLTKFADEHPGGKKSKAIDFRSRKSKWLTVISSYPRCRQRRLQAVLEVPQREHPQEVPEATPSRLARYQGRTSYTSSDTATAEEGDC